MSILKSPVWMSVPMGVLIASATASGIECHGEAAEPEARARLFGKDLRIVQQIVFLQLELDERGGERRGVQRHVELPEHIGDGADVVLVAVGEDDAPHAALVGLEIADIGEDAVDAVHILVREAHPAVDHDDIAAELIGGHVLADLAETAERDYF